MQISNYFIRIGDACSQLANVVFLNGDANESISGRAFRCRWMKVVMVIDSILGVGHCESAYFSDLKRAYSTIDEYAKRNNLI